MLGLGFYWLVVNELTKQLKPHPAVAGRSSLAPFAASVSEKIEVYTNAIGCS